MDRLANGRFAPGNQLGRRFVPGQSGNPAGRPRRGERSVREWINALQDCLQPELEAIARDPALPVNQRVAAGQWLHAITPPPDLAELEGLLTGEESVGSLKQRGVNLRVIKSYRQRSNQEGGHRATIVLRDVRGPAFDRITKRCG